MKKKSMAITLLSIMALNASIVPMSTFANEVSTKEHSDQKKDVEKSEGVEETDPKDKDKDKDKDGEGTDTEDKDKDKEKEGTDESEGKDEDIKPNPEPTPEPEPKPEDTKPTPTPKPEEPKPAPKPQVPVEQTPAQAEKPVQEGVQSTTQSVEANTATVVSPGGAVKFDRNTTTEDFIAKIAGEAVKVADKNELYASVMIAQALLESGSGSSLLSKEPNYNLFGIKGGGTNGKTVVMATQEDNGTGQLSTIRDGFRVYDSYEESFEDYAKLLKGGVNNNDSFYKGAWKSETKDYKEATAFLTGKYATDTQYDKKLNGLIETYKLDRFDDLDKVIALAATFDGDAYVFGGKNPTTGFDCSGLVSWAYKEAYDIDVTSYTVDMYNETTEVALEDAQPGDLIFFKGTYGGPDFISHVEMYVSEGMMFGSNSSGIGFHNYKDSYWKDHFFAVRRLTGKAEKTEQVKLAEDLAKNA